MNNQEDLLKVYLAKQKSYVHIGRYTVQFAVTKWAENL